MFIVGDCTMAVFPAQCNSETATKAALCKASLDHFITQTKDIQVEKTHIIQLIYMIRKKQKLHELYRRTLHIGVRCLYYDDGSDVSPSGG